MEAVRGVDADARRPPEPLLRKCVSGEEGATAVKEVSSERERLLHYAAIEMRRRRSMVSSIDEVPGFVRTVHTLLKVSDPTVIGWSEDGTRICIVDPARFAAEICPKFFRHRNINSFARLLNMYQFHKVHDMGQQEVIFEHPHFQREREDLLPLVQRKNTQSVRDELIARELKARSLVAPAVVVEAPPTHKRAQPSSMSRMRELEAEVRCLQSENERLGDAEAEAAALSTKLNEQRALIENIEHRQQQQPQQEQLSLSQLSALTQMNAMMTMMLGGPFLLPDDDDADHRPEKRMRPA